MQPEGDQLSPCVLNVLTMLFSSFRPDEQNRLADSVFGGTGRTTFDWCLGRYRVAKKISANVGVVAKS